MRMCSCKLAGEGLYKLPCNVKHQVLFFVFFLALIWKHLLTWKSPLSIERLMCLIACRPPNTYIKRGFVLFAWEGLLPWTSPSSWAYTLEATTLKLGKALGSRPFTYMKYGTVCPWWFCNGWNSMVFNSRKHAIY